MGEVCRRRNKAILKKAKQAGVATLYTTPKYQRMNACERMKENGEMLKREFSESESDEISKLNVQLSAQIKAFTRNKNKSTRKVIWVNV